MTKKRITKLVHEGEYVAAVKVELIYTDDEWSPYLSWEDALKLDDVRMALRQRNLKAAATQARVFDLVPIPA